MLVANPAELSGTLMSLTAQPAVDVAGAGLIAVVSIVPLATIAAREVRRAARRSLADPGAAAAWAGAGLAVAFASGAA